MCLTGTRVAICCVWIDALNIDLHLPILDYGNFPAQDHSVDVDDSIFLHCRLDAHDVMCPQLKMLGVC